MKRSGLVIGLIILVSMSLSYGQTPASKYRIANKIHVDGEGGWDYLTMDDSTSRLFISHASVCNVLDVKGKKPAGTIPDTKGIHGIALAGDLNKGFTSNGRDTS